MLRSYLLALALLAGHFIYAQIPGCDGTRYLTEIFTSVDTVSDLQFGANTTFSGSAQDLF